MKVSKVGQIRLSNAIVHRSANFVALGRVSYATAEGRMGIAFTQIEPNDQLILEKWVEELREH